MVTLKRSANLPRVSKHPVTWLAVLFLIGWSAICRAEFTASVDRTIINQHDTVELTLRSDKQQFGAEPDLSPLHELFTVLGRSQRSQFQSVNGKTQSWTDWIITIRPKQSGYVVIPPISLKGEKTSPITLDVKDGGTQQPSDKNVLPVFIEASLDKETVYVQEQAILTIYIYHSVPLYDDANLTPLDIDNAISQQLGKVKNYETIINGKRYGVIELKYVIFPQESGELLIPSLTFTGTTVKRNTSYGVFSRQVGIPVEEYSSEIKLTVNPPPPGTKGHWLPAKKLTLEESWSTDSNKLKVGDSITRTIKIKAEGLTAAQLPPLKAPELTDVKLYPDQSQTKDSSTDQGIIGLRVESTALVPTQAGSIELPEIRYRWFNTQTKQMEEAVLPAKQITVTSTTSNSQTTQPAPPTTEAAPNSQPATPTEPASNVVNEAEPASSLWSWLTLLFAVLWLVTLGLWLRQRQNGLSQHTTPATHPLEKTATKALFAALLGSCDQQNLLEIRRLFIQWSCQYLNDSTIQSLKAADEYWQQPALSTYLAALDNQLYGDKSQPFDSASFKQQLKQLQPIKSAKAEPNSLMPLYPKAI